VIGQYGPDANAVQLLGLQKKSERKRLVRRAASYGYEADLRRLNQGHLRGLRHPSRGLMKVQKIIG
jgi:hypothetical protein